MRNELSTKCIVSFFKSADELATLVGAAVHQWETKSRTSVPEEKIIAELDLNQYREAVSKRYGNIDLDALTPSTKEDYLRIKLSSVFVEQSVRENPPPVELPKEIWKKMREEWDPEKECLPEGLTAEDIKRAKESYYSKEQKSVLDVISDERNKYIVILGDPGSGKSTLTKYIILSVSQLNIDEKLSMLFNSYLPLRVELREFAGLCAEKDCKTFLDYFQHLEETEGYSLTKEEVDNYLRKDGKSIIIFDGLDEIFDPKEWERINHMIVGFTLDYPKVRVIVTSRIVGYKRKILDDAGFIHFTLQDFEEEQIETFLDRWYPLVVDEKEIENRKLRIVRALKNSPSIRQLAGNPLLLTILAIIGKHQELPRERWKLYDHAASVLVQNWEVNKHLKRSPVDMDFIGEDDKKELLMKIAYKMQSGPEGLAGNFIHRETLQQEIEIYLQNRYQKNPSDAKSIARSIIDQLRKVNFILCLYGADFYGFVHRTFLEYFYAMDIVQRFDNRELDPEELKSNYFEKYWEDPTWHEVLSLVCGMKERFAGEIIECLMQVYNPQWFGNRPPLNISLAIKCLGEIRNPNAIGETAKKLLERLLKLFEMVRWTEDISEFLAEELVPAAKLVGNRWPHQDTIIDQFSRSQVYMRYNHLLPYPYIDFNLNNTWAEFVIGMDSNSKELQNESLRIINDDTYSSLFGVLVLGKYEPKDKNLFSLFLSLSAKSRFYFVRSTAVRELSRGWHDDPETLNIVKDRARTDENYDVRSTAVEELSRGWHDDPETLNIVKDRIINDEDNFVRSTAVEELSRGWRDDPETLNIIKDRIINDEDNFVRSTAVGELSRGWHDDPETLNIIKDKIINDEDNIVRNTAVRELSRGWHDDPETLNIVKDRILNDDHWDVRQSAVRELARGWHDDPETLKFIKYRALNDDHWDVRQSAVQELKKWWIEEADENDLSEIITQVDPSISDISSVKNVSEDLSGDAKSENIEVENVQALLDTTSYDENSEVTENIEIPEKVGAEKVDSLINVKNIAELKMNSDSDNVETLLVSVSKREKEIIRVAAVQLNFKLSDTRFPPQIIDKNQSKSKVLKALKMACDNEADIVCLPELCICEDWIPEIKDVCQNIAVIAGSYYDTEKRNVCKPLLDHNSNVPSQIKIIPSPFEEKGIISQKMVSGDRLHIYETKVGKFAVLICRDFINMRHQLRGKTDILFVPSYNKEIKWFHDDANNHVTNSPAYIVISNTSHYGGTSVFGRIRKELNSELVDAGYKAKEDGLYKLCELKEGEEGLIIADFNLVHKSIQVPTPANPAEDIRPVPYIEKKVIEL